MTENTTKCPHCKTKSPGKILICRFCKRLIWKNKAYKTKPLKIAVTVSIVFILVLFLGYRSATSVRKIEPLTEKPYVTQSAPVRRAVTHTPPQPVTRPYNIDTMTSYAVIIGRASGCGVNTSPEMARIGKWFDANFSSDSKEKSTQLLIFMAGVKHHADMQYRGESPDSCEQVRKVYNTISWP